MILDALAALAAGYFLGGLPTAALVARLRGRDIFLTGSGNMGAMNTARNVGYAAGVLVAAVDVAKGAAGAAVGSWMFGYVGVSDPFVGAVVGGVGATLGHAWSPYVEFRGGKALATILGAATFVDPVVGAYGLLSLAGFTLLLRRQTPAAVIALTLFPFVAAAALARAGASADHAFTAATGVACMSVVSIVKHLHAARRRRAER